MKLLPEDPNLIELLYYISGILIAVLGFFILKQIKLSQQDLELTKKLLINSQEELNEFKKQSKINAERESSILSFDRLEDFTTNIINEYNKHCISLNSLDYMEMDFEKMDFDYNHFIKNKTEFVSFYNSKIINNQNANHYSGIELLNKLELFSTQIKHKIIDEKICFISISHIYCGIIEDLYPFITIRRNKKGTDNVYDAIIELYNKWNSIIKSDLQINNIDKALKQKTKEINDLKETQKTIEKTPPFEKPLGV